MSETTFVNDMVAELNTYEGCFAQRINVTVSHGYVRSAINGTADILCCYRGRFFAIEGKSKRGTQRVAQARYQRSIERAGGAYFIARDRATILNTLGIDPNTHPRQVSRERVIPR